MYEIANMNKLLITGGAGFIGSNAVSYFFEKGYDIVVVDKLTYAADSTRVTDKNIKLCIADIGSVKMPEIMLEEKPDVVINFAASSHVDRSLCTSELGEFVNSNAYGVANLANAVRQANKKLGTNILFVQISTDEVFGDLPLASTSEGFNEHTAVNPNNTYSASKAAGELLLTALARTYKDFNFIICRATNNYGPNQHWEKFIPTVIQSVLDNKAIPVYGKGDNIREWLYVEDFVRGIERAIEFCSHERKPGWIHEAFHFGSGQRLSNLKLVKTIIGLMHAPEELITLVPDRPGHDQKYALCCAETQLRLGWTAKTEFLAGLRATILDLTNRKLTRGSYAT